MLDALVQNVVLLALFIVFCFTFTGIGLLVLKRVPATFASPWESILFSFGIGAAVTGYGVFILATGQLLIPPALYLLCALLLGAAIAGWRFAGVRPSLSDLRPRGVVEWGAALLLLLLLAAELILTLTPETGRDALIYHLAAPKIFLEHHGFRFIPGNPLAHGPFQAEMLFLLALFLKGEVLAKLVNFSFFLSILLAIRQFALTRTERNDVPYLSMLVFAAIPSVFIEAHTAYVDLAVTFFTLGALYAFLTWYERNERGWLLLSAAFTGIALASKFTTLIIPAVGALGILWRYRDGEDGKEALPALASYILVTLLLGAPHYVKDWLLTGNPFYPFFHGIFGGKGWEAEQARLFDGMVLSIGMGRGPLDYLLLPWNVSVNARLGTMLFDGVVSPVFLLVLPFLAGMRKLSPSTKAIMAYSLVLFLFWASASQQIRFLIPILPLLAVLSGAVLTHYRERRGAALFISASIAGCLIYNAGIDVRDFTRYEPVGVVVGTESRAAFLERNIPPYRMYRSLNELPRDAKVYLIYMRNLSFLCDRECYSDYMFEQYTLQKVLDSSATPEEVCRKIKGMGFTHMMFDENYITGEPSLLTPEEKALFTAFREKYLTLLKNDRSYYLYRL